MLTQVAIFLAAAVVAVPIFKRLGLGSVLGYLAAGAVIGPVGLDLIDEVESTLHIAELGVVLLLFVIGLELQPARVWRMRGAVFGAGSVQVLATAALVGAAALLLGADRDVALVAALGLSLSSTAFAMQVLGEKNELTSGHGRAAFGVLLFQDVAAIPMLALVPLLGSGAAAENARSGWMQAAIAAGVIVGLIVAGRFLLRPAFRFIALARSHELSTASALLVVISTSLLMQVAGLSMALGAFLAGVLLADSEYRHELEASIEPFKGLLLGLFFIAVGMSADFRIVLERPGVVVGLVLGLVGLKMVVLYGLGRLTHLPARSSLSLAIAISQGGEFAFVLFGLAATAGVLARPVVELLVVVVTLSMVVTPLLFLARDAWFRRMARTGEAREFDTIEDDDSRVIIAGFGRFGQIIGRILSVKRIRFTALDASAAQVDFVRRFGNRIYYGDPSRVDLLRAARADKAEVLVLAVDDMEASLKTLETVKHHFPKLRVVARARNRQHAYALLGAGVELVIRETFHGSLEAARITLEELGMPSTDASEVVWQFAEYDEQQVRRVAHLRDDMDALIASAREYTAELERLFDADARS